MAEWEYFDMGCPRPTQVGQYSESERPILSRVVSMQVAALLEAFGREDTVDVNIDDSIDVEDAVTYRILQLDEFLLDDDSEIVITQPSQLGTGWDTRLGVYGLEHNDDNGLPISEFTVHHPFRRNIPPIYHVDGSEVQLDMLQEIHEVLIVVRLFTRQVQEENITPYLPAHYPVRAAGPTFLPIEISAGNDLRYS